MTKVIITVFRRAMQGKSKWDKSVDDIPYRYIGGTAASGTKVLTMFYRAMQGNKKKKVTGINVFTVFHREM